MAGSFSVILIGSPSTKPASRLRTATRCTLASPVISWYTLVARAFARLNGAVRFWNQELSHSPAVSTAEYVLHPCYRDVVYLPGARGDRIEQI